VRQMYNGWMKRGQARAKRDAHRGGKETPGKEGEAKKGSSLEGAPGGGASDMMAELKAKSSFYQHIEAQVKEYAPLLKELAHLIAAFGAEEQAPMRQFQLEIEATLSQLVDEVQVLRRVEGWPGHKVDLMREVCLRYNTFERLTTRVDDHRRGRVEFRDPFAALDGHMRAFDGIQKALDPYMRTKEEDSRRYSEHGVPFDWNALKACKLQTMTLARLSCECALGEHAAFVEAYTAMAEDQALARKASVLFNRAFNFLQRSFEFSFKVFGYCGVFDTETEAIFERVHSLLHEMEEIKHQRQAAQRATTTPPSSAAPAALAEPQAVTLTLDQAMIGGEDGNT